MSKIQDIDRLIRATKDAEIRLKSIRTAIEQHENEISVLSPRKMELERNIEFHKQTDTIPLAHEYKKAKAELSKIKNRLSLIIADKAKAEQACLDIEKIIEKFKRDHASLIITSENNILVGNFGGRHGKR